MPCAGAKKRDGTAACTQCSRLPLRLRRAVPQLTLRPSAQVDIIFKAAALAANGQRIPLAKMAVEGVPGCDCGRAARRRHSPPRAPCAILGRWR